MTVSKRSTTRRPTLRNFVPSTSTRPRWRISPHDLTPGRKRQIPLVPCGSAHEINRDIINDARMQLPQEFRAGQNIAAAAILLQTLPEQEDPAQKGLHRQVRNLVELAAVQQAESSSLHRRQAAAS